MSRAIWSLTAVLLLLGAGAWQAAPLAANANPAGHTFDCCLDPTCPPGCCPECPPDCLSLNVTTKARTPEKAECCPSEACCDGAAANVSKTSAKTKYICPPCPLCPGW